MATLSAITSALERCWAAIRTVHPNVAPATMVVYLHPAGDRKGHFAWRVWSTRAGLAVDEVHVSSHVLADGAIETFHVLLHESVHSACQTMGIQDTSRQGRYHNKLFATVAGQMGLITFKESSIGWSTSGISTEAASTFRNVIEDLAGSIDLWQARRPRNGPGGKRKSRSLKATCPACHRVIRLSRKCWDAGPVLCVPCAMDFDLEGIDNE